MGSSESSRRESRRGLGPPGWRPRTRESWMTARLGSASTRAGATRGVDQLATATMVREVFEELRTDSMASLQLELAPTLRQAVIANWGNFQKSPEGRRYLQVKPIQSSPAQPSPLQSSSMLAQNESPTKPHLPWRPV